MWKCVAFVLSGLCFADLAQAEMLKIPKGVYKLFYKEKAQEEVVPMPSFWVDRHPVTNQEFLQFLRKNPQWTKSSVPRIFAGENYLQQWPEDLKVPPGKERNPVVAVSWFAAKKYCEFVGKRLLTVNEWEYASDPANPGNTEKILHWYAQPNTAAGPVGQGAANRFGLQDMHGLVWEWVEDFSSVFIKGDSRSDNDRESRLFCGSGALGATAVEEYTTFMRFAFRSSLKATYATENLGFRCGKD